VAIFLIEYDRESGSLIELREFSASNRAEASAVRIGRELELLKSGRKLEVVILEAASIDALRQTHQRYFQNAGELVESGRVSVTGLSPNRPTEGLQKAGHSRDKSSSLDGKKVGGT
jgi:hypothetical protein